MECSLGEFLDGLGAGDPQFPLGVQLEVTSSCNFRCTHCYVVRSADYCPTYLPTPQLLEILGVLRDWGTLFVGLTGGEPLLHPDFERIYTSAVGQGFLVTLMTNGSLIDRDRARLLTDLPPRYVSVSVYGASRETYAAVTRDPNGYDALLEALGLLAAGGVDVKLKFMLLRENAHEAQDIEELADRLGMPLQFDGGVTPAADGCLAPLSHRLSASELASVERSLRGGRSEIENQLRASGPPDSDRAFQCRAGVDAAFIDVRGRVSVCPEEMHRWPLDPHDVEGSLGRIFREEFPAFLAGASLAPECHSCELWGLCLRCPAWRKKEAGHHGAVVPFFCEVAECHARELGDVRRPPARAETLPQS